MRWHFFRNMENLLGFFNHLGWLIQTAIDHALKIESYKCTNDCVVRQAGLFHEERIPLDSITSWKATPEQSFDIVDLEIRNGYDIRWLDTYNDLLAILREKVDQRESKS